MVERSCATPSAAAAARRTSGRLSDSAAVSGLDTLGPQWSQNLLADKVYSGFTSTSTEHGGQESTLLALYIVGAVSNGVVRHIVQTLPLWFPIVLGLRQREINRRKRFSFRR